MITRIQERPKVRGTKTKWYIAVAANCHCDSSTIVDSNAFSFLVRYSNRFLSSSTRIRVSCSLLTRFKRMPVLLKIPASTMGRLKATSASSPPTNSSRE